MQVVATNWRAYREATALIALQADCELKKNAHVRKWCLVSILQACSQQRCLSVHGKLVYLTSPATGEACSSCITMPSSNLTPSEGKRLQLCGRSCQARNACTLSANEQNLTVRTQLLHKEQSLQRADAMTKLAKAHQHDKPTISQGTI